VIKPYALNTIKKIGKKDSPLAKACFAFAASMLIFVSVAEMSGLWYIVGNRLSVQDKSANTEHVLREKYHNEHPENLSISRIGFA
jgi:hypothetical protein